MNEDQSLENDPFILRALEHWLEVSNELGYQPVFCSWLSAAGYTLKYSIRNTNFEQGKDVVAIDPDGKPCGFQLKGGDIDLERWRREVKPEIEALIETPLQHPDIAKTDGHLSYLVTNGEVSDSVRDEIIHLNEGRWKDSPLRYWSKGDLVKKIQQMVGGVLPRSAEHYQQLTKLIFQSGISLCDRADLFGFLSSILEIEREIPKSRRKRNIAASIMYTALVTGNFQREKNHASIINAYTLLASLVLFVADKYELEDRYWLEEFQTIRGELMVAGKELERHLIDNPLNQISELPLFRELLPYRKNAALTALLSFKLSQLLIGHRDWISITNPELISTFRGCFPIWGEAGLIPLAWLSLLLKHGGQHEGFEHLTDTVISAIVARNGRNAGNEIGLLPPYLDLTTIIGLKYGIDLAPFEGSTLNSSYALGYWIGIAARGGCKELLQRHWREISFIGHEEFLPENPCGIYLLTCEKGDNLTRLPRPRERWSNLVEQTGHCNEALLPRSLTRFPEFAPFLLSVLPHRATPNTVALIDCAATKALA